MLDSNFRVRGGALAAVLVGLASCSPALVSRAPPSLPPVEGPAKAPATALEAGVRAGPDLPSLGVTPASAAAALTAFRISCPSLVKRTDASGLSRPEDWSPACTAASASPPADAMQFFATHFDTVEVGEGKAFATGYFEPEIVGSRQPGPGYAVPVYAKPGDLVEADLGLFSESLKGRRIRGRVEKGQLVPYADRSAIEDGALAGRGLEIAWAADPIDFFFLQIQGSGRLMLPNGDVMRIGYAGQNGRDYVGIGKLMKERGLLGPGQTSMQGIVAWLRAHPEEGRAIMRENKSYVFFHELTGPGPLGALGLPVTPRASVAADPKFVPLGAPIFLSVDKPVARGLWVAQDTGGAIKGANRFDTFWGAGEEAKEIAGGMQAEGKAYILLPKGVLARLAPDHAAPSQR